MHKRILLIEDEKSILELMEMTLGDEGYNVFAINHYEPVEYIMEFAPNLVLLDVRLQNGYGHLLCKDLKENPKTSDIKVILVSGASNLERIAHEYKADNFLSKPFSVDELITLVKNTIN